MSEEHLSDDAVDELAPETQEAEGKFPLTPRMIAIAKGEDPDAIDAVAEDAPVEEQPEDEQLADAADEVAVDEPASNEPKPSSWITDTDKQLAKAYGLDPEDLSTLSSREEFGRLTRAIDKASTRRTIEPPAPVAPKADADAPVDDTNPRDANGKLNLAYFEKNFDEATVELVKEQIANSEAREKQNQSIDAFRQQQEEREWMQHVGEFHRAAEEIRPDFFGRTIDKSGLPVDLSQTELDRRQKLWNAAEIITDHMIREQERNGLPPSVPPWAQVLKQAEVLAFGDEIAKHEKAAQRANKTSQLQRIAAQSQRRRPVSSTAGSHAAYRNAPPTNPHTTEAIMQHPDVEAVLRRIEDKNR